jgi:hypothetical protein
MQTSLQKELNAIFDEGLVGAKLKSATSDFFELDRSKKSLTCEMVAIAITH